MCLGGLLGLLCLNLPVRICRVLNALYSECPTIIKPDTPDPDHPEWVRNQVLSAYHEATFFTKRSANY